jgi:hypothetical protein
MAPDSNGSLRQVSLAEVLRNVETGKWTGRLTLGRGPLRAEVYFAGGQWLTLDRNGAVAPLAHRLAQSGIITPQQFQMATGLALAEAGLMPDVQAVRLLISARMLTQDQLRQWCQNDAVSLLTVVLGWNDGDFIFDEGAPPPPGSVSLPVPVTPLLAQAMRAIRGAPRRDIAPLAPDTIIDFAEVDPTDNVGVHVTREQWRVLTMMDGQMPLWAIAQNLQAPEPVIVRLAGELAEQGIIKAVGSVAPSAVEPFA